MMNKTILVELVLKNGCEIAFINRTFNIFHRENNLKLFRHRIKHSVENCVGEPPGVIKNNEILNIA